MVARQDGADAADPALAGRLVALRPYLDGEVALTVVAAEHGIALRTARRWVARLRAGGPAGLGRKPRSDTGRRRLAPDLVALVEGWALTRPRLSIATIHRRACEVARTRGWPGASYASVHAIVTGLDPALVTLAL
ncbi:helix-turn-helix domain containing protein, partial [Methylobacterium sp. J-077]|uniref:helix-turn-helix domain containing protein n=1 Tax=Methylobacterium sp. J-077 TaxID=2836656 RepID=UPI001FBB64F8